MTLVDEAFMRDALEAAKKGLGRTSPNPAVGAVIVKEGSVIARGHHRAAGTDHAEVAALRTLDFQAEGCELYSTLEPCAHEGRTGPCTEAIIRAGIRRVVVGAIDPNPRVHGKGLARLEQAGISVTRGVLEAECTAINEVYNLAIVKARPFVLLKAAVSLDGRIATRTGASQWITSEASREEARRLRDRFDAVLVGVGTVLADDPKLTVRLPNTRDPVRVVLDSQLRTPVGAQVVRTAKDVRTILCTTRAADEKRRRALEAAGVEVLVLRKTREGRVDLESVLEALHARDLIGLLVEGGAHVHGAFVDARLVDRVAFFLAPMILGGEQAPMAVGGRGVARLTDALRLETPTVRMIGPDLLLTAAVEAE